MDDDGHKSRCGFGFATTLTRAATTGAAALCLGLLPDLTADGLQAQPPPGPALTVTGTLVDEEGAPAAGLDLDLRPYPSRYERRLHDLGEPGGLQAAVDSTRSGANGAFTLTAPAVGTYRLDIAVAAGDATPGDRRVVPAPVFHTLAPLAAPIVLPPIEVPTWHTLTVGVKDLEGQPVEGALVVADPALWRSERADSDRGQEPWNRRQERVYPRFGRAAAQTDAAGLATFSMPTAEANVFVSAPGFRLRAGPIGDRGGAFELTPGPGVTVRVLDPQGRPVPRAAVTVGASQDVPLALTDDRGEATVGLAGSDSLVYQAIAEDRSLAWTAPLGPEAGDAGAPLTVEVRLKPPAEIAGRVTDAATGSPVAGAAVWYRPGEQTRSGPGGAFVLRAWLYQGQAQVSIAADGYQATTATVTAERLRAADGVDIVLAPSALLRGDVVDDSGSPVAGAWLRIEPSGRGGVWSIGPGQWQATSAADGSFFFAGAASGHAYRIRAEANGYAPTTVAIPASPAGAARAPVRVALTRGRLVQGIIADPQGVPIPGAEVALLPVAATGDGGYSWSASARRTSTTDARGAFEFPGTPPGRHELTANHPDHVRVLAAAFDVPSGEGAKDLGTLTLEAGATIEGVVRDFRGGPVGGARVSAHQGNIDPRRLHEPEIRAAVTETDGTFRIGGLRDEPADIVVVAEGYARSETTAVRPQAGALIEVQLGEGARLVGRVLDADGEGTANAFVSLSLDRGPIISRTAWSTYPPRHDTTTDGDGRFHFDALGPGPWSVQVAGEQLAEDVGAIRLRPGEQREIELRLLVQGRLAGVVTNAFGEPVAGAQVLIQSLDPAGQVTGTRSGPRADAGGAYEAQRVPSGPARGRGPPSGLPGRRTRGRDQAWKERGRSRTPSRLGNQRFRSHRRRPAGGARQGRGPSGRAGFPGRTGRRPAAPPSQGPAASRHGPGRNLPNRRPGQRQVQPAGPRGRLRAGRVRPFPGSRRGPVRRRHRLRAAPGHRDKGRRNGPPARSVRRHLGEGGAGTPPRRHDDSRPGRPLPTGRTRTGEMDRQRRRTRRPHRRTLAHARNRPGQGVRRTELRTRPHPDRRNPVPGATSRRRRGLSRRRHSAVWSGAHRAHRSAEPVSNRRAGSRLIQGAGRGTEWRHPFPTDRDPG